VPATFRALFSRLVVIGFLAIACATVPQAQLGSRTPLRSPYLLSASEISSVKVNSAYDAIQRLKPNFLAGMRGQHFINRVVYLDGARLRGGLENLRLIEAASVRQIVFLSAIEAGGRYGPGNGAGALLVTTWAGTRLP
jgi:hypothetical protein